MFIIFNFFFISVFSTDNQNLKKTYYPIEINSTDAPKIDGLIDVLIEKVIVKMDLLN